MKLLIDWFQSHPQLGRVSVHCALSADGTTSNLGRGFEPTFDFSIDDVNAKLATTPAGSVAGLFSALSQLVASHPATPAGTLVDVATAQDPAPAPTAPPTA